MSMGLYGALIAGVALMAAMMGFFIGKTETKAEDAGKDISVPKKEKRDGAGVCIASPVAGRMVAIPQSEGRGVRIAPLEGKVYAPVAGKIIKLFPQGNALILRTELGRELLLRVGECRDELSSMFYRPRIVQNEMVSKGKLLLEFDNEQLQAEGESIEVTVCLKDAMSDVDIQVCEKESVKVGEEVMEIW